jgi:hypothetical protein
VIGDDSVADSDCQQQRIQMASWNCIARTPYTLQDTFVDSLECHNPFSYLLILPLIIFYLAFVNSQ